MKKFFKNLWRQAKQIPYWIRTHTIHRYHIIDCRNPKNGYDWGWCDRDHLMWFACFKIFQDFMEREYPHGLTDYEANEAWSHAHKEMKEIYYWWTEGRALEHAEHERLLDEEHPNGITFPVNIKETTFERVQRLDAKDEEMLDRLMKIRGFLWT